MIAACFSLILMISTETATLSTFRRLNSTKVISKRQVQTSCDKGWYPFENRCYRAGGTKKMRLTWEKAAQHCKKLGGRLASIHSQELSDFLTAFVLLDVQYTSWIGLNDRDRESEYKWDDGTEVDFTNWEPSEPSGHSNPKEDCVNMVYISGRSDGRTGNWNDLECEQERELICQRNKRKQIRKHTDPRFCPSRIGGWRLGISCYHVVSEKLSWQEAEAYCIDKHDGHLLTIKDFRVNLFIQYILRNYTEDVWIGIKIKDELQQQWSSGWYVSFNDWMEEPGNFSEGACAIRTVNKWTTIPCRERMSFICEISTVSETVPSLASYDELICPNEPVGWRDFGGEFCYYIDTNHVTWYEANFRCMRRGGTLASFHSQTVLDILHPFLMIHFTKARFNSWIGLYRHMQYEEEFVWADGSPLNFTAWAIGEPSFENEQCGEVNPQTMEWYNYFCNHHRPFICSVRKISSNRTANSEVRVPLCVLGRYTTEDLFGVILCVLIIGILLGVVIYYFCRHYQNEQRARKASRVPVQPSLRDQMPKYRSANEIVIASDV
ncbi:macrophage mannose receptor 1 [Parasteatoda tepidariorum]|uniref:macrophage mannose receptor 1 n=1 Tax=Parasteatoda tepidariorum TaxID=114398 RepID=UPI001C71AB03|nr:macrophage mannose receptor 1 [Parasteatoda tepidariorum]